MTLDMTLERETFGPVLRAARERRGISLRELAADTKVSVELWSDLEDNNFLRWPERLYARTYIREYAARVGLDPEATVDQFCRLFPEQGDRRAEGLLRAHAAIVQHDLDWQEGPPARERRGRHPDDGTTRSGFLTAYHGRLLAIGVDVTLALVLTVPFVLLHFAFWPALAVTAVTYHAAGVLVSERSFGAVLTDWCLKTFRSWPVARRLVSTRAEGS